MIRRSTRRALLTALALVPPAVQAQPADTRPSTPSLSFQVTFDPAVQTTPYSGRVYVVLSRNFHRPPRTEINNWLAPPQVFALDVEGVLPGRGAVIDDKALFYPKPLPDLPAGKYSIQAIARRSRDHPVPGSGPGDLFSQARTVSLDPARPSPVELRLDRVVEETPFRESDRLKEVVIVSRLLSEFHGREMKLRAGVVLPPDWRDDPAAKYPVLYTVPGFGGDHRLARWTPMMMEYFGVGALADQILQVVLDPTCYRGHSVFADSDNNGPWGRALIEELIPHIEKKFHGAQSARHRYVTGMSSGGWSSLWLQISYPDVFNGCWSHAPDPVDFRDFQRINLYDPAANMYVDQRGERRPIARHGDSVVLWYDDFVRREEVLGPGGQIHSFEACFSRRGEDGTPQRLFDRTTGCVDSEVARSWERYDIRLVLERNWDRLAPKLAGKLHVYVGGNDSFYLDGAVGLLKDALAKLGSDAEVKVIPGMGHEAYAEAFEPMLQTILGNFRRSPSSTQPAADSPP